MWLIYDAVSGSIGGVANDILVISSAVIGIIRLDIDHKKKDVQAENDTADNT
jgi:soluble P-type ATPase